MQLNDRDYDLLSQYIDDALTPPERRAVESRLATDAEYRDELAALRQTVALVRSLPEMIAPRDLRLSPKTAAAIAAEFSAVAPAVRPRMSFVRTLTSLAAAAASLVLVLAGTFSLLQPAAPPPAGPTVAVADVMLEEAANSTDELRTQDGVADLSAAGTVLPTFDDTTSTGGMGGAVDPAADLTMMQAPQGTFAADEQFDAAPLQTEQEETLSLMQYKTPEDDADSTSSFMAPAPAATNGEPRAEDRSLFAATDAAPGEAESAQSSPVDPPVTSASMTDAGRMAAPTGTPAPISTPVALAATETLLDTLDAERSVTAVADMRERDDAPQERAPAPQPSPLSGFALVIAGVALGVATLIAWSRRG